MIKVEDGYISSDIASMEEISQRRITKEVIKEQIEKNEEDVIDTMIEILTERDELIRRANRGNILLLIGVLAIGITIGVMIATII